MYRYKKLMVALNLDDNDAMLIQYAGFVSKMANSSDIYFVHVSDSFDIPDEIKKIYPEIISPVDKAAQGRMQTYVEKIFDGPENATLHYKAVEGSRLGTLVSYSQQYDIDLMVISHCTGDTPVKGCYSEKVARKAFCSVMIIPPGTPAVRLDDILVSTDFSDHSQDSLDVGSAFAKAAGIASIDVLNIFRVPRGYYKTGKDFDEFAELMRKNARAKSEQYVSYVDLKGVGVNPHFVLNDKVVEGIQEFADKKDTSLIVVGARGRSGGIAAVLLGSVTEGLIRNLNRPLLAVKKKGEGLNILEAMYPE